MINPFPYLSNGYQWLQNPYHFLDQKLKTDGLTFRKHLPILGNVVLTGEPALIQKIITSGEFGKGEGVGALKSILGSHSLIMKDGKEHLKRRIIVAPNFKGKAIAEYDEATIQYTEKIFYELDRHKPFSIYQIIQKISLRIIVVAIFGNKEQEELQYIESLVEKFLQSFKSPLVLFFKPFQVNLGKYSPWGKALQNRENLCSYILQEIGLNEIKKCNSILSHLLGAKEDGIPLQKEEIIGEVFALLLFGHDTGAATMSWVIAHIYQNPKIVEKLQVYVKQEYNAGSELTYLEACIKESMRLCPVVVHLTRKALKDTTITHYKIRKGDTVLPCTYLAHHNPAVFTEPYQFFPERFMDGKTYEYSYFPFGLGVRTCIGKPFVMRQMKLILSVLMKHFYLQFAPNYIPKPKRHFVLILPQQGCLMVKK
ncbi:MAG: cytochrome P450 [Leptospiraceae bacterium]|nr:cytochrome P450 [Leptospiraceae bacterium]